jgi:hypothetical protein
MFLLEYRDEESSSAGGLHMLVDRPHSRKSFMAVAASGILIWLSVLVACPAPGGNAPNVPAGPPLTGGNAYAALSGPTFGGTSANSSLEKAVPLNVLSSNPDIQIPSSAEALQQTSSGTALYMAIPVKNVGTRAYSFVELTNILYKNGGSVLNATPDVGFVKASVGELTGNVFADSCLAPGETGYVMLIALNLYSSVTSISLSVSTFSQTPIDPGSALIPQSYAISGTSGSGTLTQIFQNTGLLSLDLNNAHSIYCTFVALDASNNPIMWGFTNSNLSPVSGLLSAGQSGSIAGTYSFDGSSSRVVAFTSFEVDAPAKTVRVHSLVASPMSGASNPDAWTKAVLDARNQSELAKMRLVGDSGP